MSINFNNTQPNQSNDVPAIFVLISTATFLNLISMYAILIIFICDENDCMINNWVEQIRTVLTLVIAHGPCGNRVGFDKNMEI